MSSKSIDDLVFFAENEPDYDESLTAADKCVTGRPLQRIWHHFTSSDGALFAGIWEAEPGCWNIDYTETEFCQIISGHSVLRDEQGRARPLKAGDNFVIPAGFRGQWEVLETTRKIYVIYEP